MILSPPTQTLSTQACCSAASYCGWRFAQCLFVSLFLSVTPVFAANPDPSSTSTLGMVVHNPATNATVTVTGFIVDPTGTPTAGTVAFVLTSDGYSFLVKPVGDLIYNSDDPPVAMKIISKDSAAGTVQIRPSSLAPTDPTTSLGYQTLLVTMEG
ncbi:MAG: outer rane autotransporter barrel domain, partial [Prosthecobacter sp.]|nr:outer rane autotransporter barrel domain [Prosthecobacter sp.]